MSDDRDAPRWARWFLRVTVGRDRREEMIGDLDEVHRRRSGPFRWLNTSVDALQIGITLGAGRLWGRVGNTTGGEMRVAGLWNDARFALRGLFRAPGFMAITIGTLALGIGATTAIFSVLNGVLLKPLPFEDPDELVSIWHTVPAAGLEFNMSDRVYFTYRDENRFFEDIGCWNNGQVSVTGLAEPEQLSAMWVTAGFLPLLRVQPVMGRRFSEEDDSPGAPQTIILSYAYWQRQFGADSAVVGSTLRVDGIQREIVGVLPSEFALPGQDAAIYIPFQWDRTNLLAGVGYHGIARLSPGATIELANADVERMAISVEGPPRYLTDRGEPIQVGANLRPLKQDFVGDIGNVLWVLLGTVGMVLLIACANVANLFLVRVEGRRQEVAVRRAMGAARGQIARQFLLESQVFGLLGGLAGLGLAFGGVRLLTWMGPETLPRLNEISLDPTVLAFTLGISLLSGLLFGLFPVFRTGGLDLVSSLKEGGRGGTGVGVAGVGVAGVGVAGDGVAGVGVAGVGVAGVGVAGVGVAGVGVAGVGVAGVGVAGVGVAGVGVAGVGVAGVGVTGVGVAGVGVAGVGVAGVGVAGVGV